MKNISSQNFESVGFWRRAGALLIDMIVINIIIVSQFSNAISQYFTNFSLTNGIKGQMVIPTNVYIIILMISILAVLYFAFFEYYLGQTVGDMFMRIRTISLASDTSDIENGNKNYSGENSNISLWKAIVRNCYIIPFFPFYIFWIIEPLYLAFYKERFLEKITLTKTVYYGEYTLNNLDDRKNKNKYKGYKLEKV